MGKSIWRAAAGAGLAALLFGTAAHAALIFHLTPDAAYLAATTRIDITDPDHTPLTSLSDGTETVDFDIGLDALTVPTTWATWGAPPDTESSTPRVLWTNGFSDLTMTLTVPVATFGFEAEPNTLGEGEMSASFFHGADLILSLTRIVDGNAGARLFAVTSTTDTIDRIVFSNLDLDDFAIAQVRYSIAQVVPEPGSIGLCVLGVGLMVLLRSRRHVPVIG